MKKKQTELNTAVKAIFKDGTSKDFTSIEEASQSTGISIASIKIRANRPGSKGKDGTTFMWLDEHTRRSYQARKSKSKGSSLEYDIVKKLKEIGYKSCTTSRGESKKLDNSKVDIADPSNELPIYIQAKHLTNTPNYFGIREECPLKDKPFVVIWKKSSTGNTTSPGTIAMIDVNYFYRLLKIEKEYNK